MTKSIQQKSSTFDSSLWEKILEERYAEMETKRLDFVKTVEEKLKTYFKHKNVKRVYLFGSILKEGEFYEFSDIDIAVEGLEEAYFRTCAEVEEVVGVGIDIVEMEKCRFRDSIERYGIRII